MHCFLAGYEHYHLDRVKPWREGDAPANSRCGCVPPASSNPDPISIQKCNFPHPFSDQIHRGIGRIQAFSIKQFRYERKLRTISLLAGMNRLQEKGNVSSILFAWTKFRADLPGFYPYSYVHAE